MWSTDGQKDQEILQNDLWLRIAGHGYTLRVDPAASPARARGGRIVSVRLRQQVGGSSGYRLRGWLMP
jgi:hypothetical protein